ncbi:type II toxin-antitoxin system RelE/ParE family toxin [Ramlibacter sp.]|uniref:type II toxin-antitoxin system RelE/ParE family toxin n=1 Tax=Ramlibacter sp. TaxID=1917967 RepID=UPI0035B353B1
MTLRVKISSRAAAQIRRAADWWADNRASAPGAIAQDLEECVALLADQPRIGSMYSGTRVGQVRRLYMGRVGYFIYYCVNGDDLQVLAFWHARRGRQPRL